MHQHTPLQLSRGCPGSQIPQEGSATFDSALGIISQSATHLLAKRVIKDHSETTPRRKLYA